MNRSLAIAVSVGLAALLSAGRAHAYWNDCCFDHAWPGCEASACEACVCGITPTCCSLDWGSARGCWALTETTCADSCPACVPCGSAPATGCSAPVSGEDKSKLIIRTGDDGPYYPHGNILVWTFGKGGPTISADFGDPSASSTNYRMCLWEDPYGTPSLLSQSLFYPPYPGVEEDYWRRKASGALSFKRRQASGLSAKMLAIPGAATRVKVRVTGVYAGMTNLLQPPLMQPLLIQLKNSDGGCWESSFSAPPIVNTDTVFKAKGAP